LLYEGPIEKQFYILNWLNASLNFSHLFELQSPKRDNASSQVTERAEESDKIQASRMLKKPNLSTCLCFDFVRRMLILVEE